MPTTVVFGGTSLRTTALVPDTCVGFDLDLAHDLARADRD